MADYEHTQVMSVPPETAFAFLEDPANLPLCLPEVEGVDAAGPDRVRLSGRLNGRALTVDCRLGVDRAARRLEWEVAQAGARGWLRVAPLPSGCDVTAHVSFAGPQPPAERVRSRLGKGLEAMRDRLEGRPGDGLPSVD
ncbi:SRPBCC family protein [Azospirillum sp. ST 5-10]|uniref:SRPBCC family protein n=1 Tax=unclassified Azospirillum TaxID=2630922 RepID=UPI003F49CA2D